MTRPPPPPLSSVASEDGGRLCRFRYDLGSVSNARSVNWPSGVGCRRISPVCCDKVSRTRSAAKGEKGETGKSPQGEEEVCVTVAPEGEKEGREDHALCWRWRLLHHHSLQFWLRSPRSWATAAMTTTAVFATGDDDDDGIEEEEEEEERRASHTSPSSTGRRRGGNRLSVVIGRGCSISQQRRSGPCRRDLVPSGEVLHHERVRGRERSWRRAAALNQGSKQVRKRSGRSRREITGSKWKSFCCLSLSFFLQLALVD